MYGIPLLLSTNIGGFQTLEVELHRVVSTNIKLVGHLVVNWALSCIELDKENSCLDKKKNRST